jgi:hypothetical protein
MSLVVRRYTIALQDFHLQSYVSFNDLHKHKINWEFLFFYRDDGRLTPAWTFIDQPATN